MNKLIFTFVLAVLANTTPATAVKTVETYAKLYDAVSEWKQDPEKAKADWGDMKDWDTSTVLLMRELFKGFKKFNEDISKWDTSSVTDMTYMFSEAYEFNQDIGKWDTSKVTNFSEMFGDAKSFNKDIGKWDMSSAENISMMFLRAESFNQDIGKWDTSKVTNIQAAFWKAKVFNGDISKWDISKCESLGLLFADAKKFNQDISKWNTANITSMDMAFMGATQFNKDISGWDLSSRTGKISMTYDKACNLECDNFPSIDSELCVYPDVHEDCPLDPCKLKKDKSECNGESTCILFNNECKMAKDLNTAPTSCERKGGKVCGYQPRITGPRLNKYIIPGRTGGGKYTVNTACANRRRYFDKAKVICEEAGAVLCDFRDLKGGAHRVRGTRACNMGKKKVWTSSECQMGTTNGYFVMRKDGRGRKKCYPLDKRPGNFVTCCVSS